jgi:hypothetical protein
VTATIAFSGPPYDICVVADATLSTEANNLYVYMALSDMETNSVYDQPYAPHVLRIKYFSLMERFFSCSYLSDTWIGNSFRSYSRCYHLGEDISTVARSPAVERLGISFYPSLARR